MSRERGSTLVVIAPLALIAAGMVLLSLTQSTAGFRRQETRRLRQVALADAEAALLRAQGAIKNAGYSAAGNLKILDVLENGEIVGTNEEGNDMHLVLRTQNAEAWLSTLTGGWYQIDGVARTGNYNAHVRCLVRQRDTFGRYYAFTDASSLSLTGSPTGGAIHSNHSVQFHYAAQEYTVPVTASYGFTYHDGATAENTTLAAGSNPGAHHIDMPGARQIAARSSHNAPEFLAAWSRLTGTGTASIHMELHGTTYDLISVNPSTGSEIAAVRNIPLPASGVIYVPGDLDGLKGTLDGRLTIATAGKVTITGSIQYVDGDGDTAYINGIPAPTNTINTTNTVDSDAYAMYGSDGGSGPVGSSGPYGPNPAYAGNSVLGVMAVGDIHYSESVPDSMELNAFFYSATGSFGVPSNSFPLKSSLRRLGGVATKYDNVGAYANGPTGTPTAGFTDREYVYDDGLVMTPPPQFLEMDQPLFTSYRIVLGISAAATSGEAGWNLDGIDIGKQPALDPGAGLVATVDGGNEVWTATVTSGGGGEEE